jgi:hypothetical protein
MWKCTFEMAVGVESIKSSLSEVCQNSMDSMPIATAFFHAKETPGTLFPHSNPTFEMSQTGKQRIKSPSPMSCPGFCLAQTQKNPHEKCHHAF